VHARVTLLHAAHAAVHTLAALQRERDKME
jgi:hypothetical protein